MKFLIPFIASSAFAAFDITTVKDSFGCTLDGDINYTFHADTKYQILRIKTSVLGTCDTDASSPDGVGYTNTSPSDTRNDFAITVDDTCLYLETSTGRRYAELTVYYGYPVGVKGQPGYQTLNQGFTNQNIECNLSRSGTVSYSFDTITMASQQEDAETSLSANFKMVRYDETYNNAYAEDDRDVSSGETVYFEIGWDPDFTTPSGIQFTPHTCRVKQGLTNEYLLFDLYDATTCTMESSQVYLNTKFHFHRLSPDATLHREFRISYTAFTFGEDAVGTMMVECDLSLCTAEDRVDGLGTLFKICPADGQTSIPTECSDLAPNQDYWIKGYNL